MQELSYIKECLEDLDHANDYTKEQLDDMEVVFDTTNRANLALLSSYVSGGKIHIDIGTGDE